MQPRLKVLSKVLVGVLTASSLLLNTANAADPKAGSVCKKAGLTQTGSGVAFICKKSGKKLVWTIALGIKKIPFPTPSTTASSTY